jgi:hypothetical protein
MFYMLTYRNFKGNKRVNNKTLWNPETTLKNGAFSKSLMSRQLI